MKATMNPALRDVWSRPSRFKTLYGGRDSSKSWDAAANAIRVAQSVKVRILCTRMFQNKLAESVYNLLIVQIERFGLSDRFQILRDKITCTTTGSEFLFYGLARNIDEIKSLEGIDILWIEEAHALTSAMFGILEPTIRKEGSEIWVIFNPRLSSDFAYQHFVVNPPPDSIVRLINYTENGFISKTSLVTIEALKLSNYDEYAHRYLGQPKSDSDKTIIKRSWLDAAVDAHIKLGIPVTGSVRVGYDIADDGNDTNAIASGRGILTDYIEEWKGGENELLKSCSRVYMHAEQIGGEIDYDSIGVGASAGAKFEELNTGRGKKIEFYKFNAGGKVTNPDKEYMPGVLNRDHFENIKAQAWWMVSDRMRMTYEAVINGVHVDPSKIISISSACDHLEKLLTELSTPYRDFSLSGKVKVESKKDLAKRDVKSPNIADAFIMRYAPRDFQPKPAVFMTSRHRR